MSLVKWLDEGTVMLRRVREECEKRATALESSTGGSGALRWFDGLYIGFSMMLLVWRGGLGDGLDDDAK